MSRLLLGLVLATCVVRAQDTDVAARGVRILEQRCWVCHGPNLSQSGLRLDSRDAALKGGTRGPAIVAGNAARSRVVQAIRRTEEPHMPPGPKLPDAEIATIENWIAAGAPWPKTATTTSTQAPAWWSFRKPARPPVPSLKDPWVRTSIDAF